MSRGDLLDVTPGAHDRCLTVNTRGTFFLMQAFGRRAAKAPRGTVNRSIITILLLERSRSLAPTRRVLRVEAGPSMATTLFSLETG